MSKQLKNFTVTARSVKSGQSGLISYLNYLNNQKTSSHSQTNIYAVHPSNADYSKFAKSAVSSAFELDLKNQKGKGGRPTASYAVSYCFSLPKNTIKPTPQEWKKISKEIVKVLREQVPEISKPEHLFINIHDQDNPHLNLVVQKVVNGQRLRKIDQRSLLSSFKTAFNQAVLKHCDFDYKDYQPKKIGLGKRKEGWQLIRSDMEKLMRQFDLLTKYINSQNEKRIKSTENRIIKTLNDKPENEELREHKQKLLDDLNKVNDPQFQDSLNRVRKKLKR